MSDYPSGWSRPSSPEQQAAGEQRIAYIQKWTLWYLRLRVEKGYPNKVAWGSMRRMTKAYGDREYYFSHAICRLEHDRLVKVDYIDTEKQTRKEIRLVI